MTWPTPHPIYVAVGTCLYFCLGMGHWLQLVLLLWWIWQYLGPPCPQCWHFQWKGHNQWCFGGHGLVNGAFMCSLNLSANVLSNSPIYSSSQSIPTALVSVNHPTFLEDGVSILRVYQEVLDGPASFEMYFNTIFPADVLAAFIHSFNIGHHHVGLIFVKACVVPDVTVILVGSVGFLLFEIPCSKLILDTCILLVLVWVDGIPLWVTGGWDQQPKKEDKDPLRQALKGCKYPVWALNRESQTKENQQTQPRLQ